MLQKDSIEIIRSLRWENEDLRQAFRKVLERIEKLENEKK